MEALEDLFEGNLGVMRRGQGEQGVAQEGQIGQGVDLVGARSVLAPKVIAPPVVAAFHPGPMAADELVPLRGGAFGGFLTGEIIAGLSRGRAAFLGVNLAAHYDEAAGSGKAGGIGLDGEGVQAALFGAAVAAVVGEKKGVSLSAAQASAWASRLGWLPFT